MIQLSDLLGIILAVLINIYVSWTVYLSWRRPKKLEKIILSVLDLDRQTVSRRINIMAVLGPFFLLLSLFVTALMIRVLIYGPYMVTGS